MFVELSLCYDYVQIVYREKYLISVLWKQLGLIKGSREIGVK